MITTTEHSEEGNNRYRKKNQQFRHMFGRGLGWDEQEDNRGY